MSSCVLKNDRNEYAATKRNQKRVHWHRIVWAEHNKQDIPKGMVIRHLCHQKACVNPSHLALGTYKDNMKDETSEGRHYCQKKTHCPKGHEYTPENTYITTRGGRNCRKCIHVVKMAYTRKIRAAAKNSR